MMGAESLFDNLSLREKTAIMTVLSRDRQLRETEEERVMKLRIDLARERRLGVLIAGKDTAVKKRTCARCRDSVGILESARCPVCNHIVCKKCRVPRTFQPMGKSHEVTVDTKPSQFKPGQLDHLQRICRTDSRSLEPLRRIARTDSNCSYPPELNPFEGDGSGQDKTPAKTPQQPIFRTKIPTFKYDVVEDSVVTSTPYDPRLGRSLVGGDIGAMTSPAKLNNQHLNDNDASCSRSSHPGRFSDSNRVKVNGMPSCSSSKNRSLSLSKTGRKQCDVDSSDPAFHTATNLNVSRKIRGSSPSLLHLSMTLDDDDDNRGAVSDSSAYITPAASPSQSLILGEDDFSAMNKKSHSTGYIPDFDEKEAVEFLMQIGARYEKPAPPVLSPEHRKETSKDHHGRTTTAFEELESECTIEQADDKPKQSLPNFESNCDENGVSDVTPENNSNPRENDRKRVGALSFFTSAVETITKELRAAKFTNETTDKSGWKPMVKESDKPRSSSFSINMFSTASMKPAGKSTQNPFAFLSAIPATKKSQETNIMSKFKDMLLLNPPKKPTREVETNDGAAKLFKMASNPVPNEVKCQISKSAKQNEETHHKKEILSGNETTIDQAISDSCEQQLPLDGAFNVQKSDGAKLQVESRLCQSNPNSPYRTKRKLFSISTDDAGGFMSEASVPSDSGKLRKMVSSTSDAPSTTSSDEYHRYHYARRKARSSSKINALKYDHPMKRTAIKDSGYSTHENHLKARSRYLRATRLSRRARERERDLRRLGRRSLGKSRAIMVEVSSRKESSSDPSDVRQDASVSESSSLETKYANTNVMPRKDDLIDTAAEELKDTLPNENAHSFNVGPDNVTSQPRRRTSKAKVLFLQLKSKVVPQPKDSDWVCRVCNKALDVKKKSGDWFHSSSRPEVLHFKELLLNSKRRLSHDTAITLSRMAGQVQQKPSPLTLDPDTDSQNAEVTLQPPLRRMRSNTLPCNMHSTTELLQTGTLGSSLSHGSLKDLSVDLSQLEASLQRQRLRMGKKSIAEVLHGTLLLHVPGQIELNVVG